MATKTIPQLNPATSFDENALFPIDTGVQTYKITAKNAAESFDKLSSGITAWVASRTYDEGDLVKVNGAIYRSLANGNQGNAVTDGDFWVKNGFDNIDFMDQEADEPGDGVTRLYSNFGTLFGKTKAKNFIVPRVQDFRAMFALTQMANATSTAAINRRFASISYGFSIPGGVPSTILVAGTADAVAAAGGVYTSLDGITWTARTMPANYGFTKVLGCINNTFSAAVLVAFGTNFISTFGIYTSPDGATWTARTVPSGWEQPVAVAAKPDFDDFTAAVYLAATSSGKIFRSINDAVTWTQVGTPPPDLVSIQQIEVIGGLFYLYGHDGTSNVIYTSPDGTTWTQIVHNLPPMEFGGYSDFKGLQNGTAWICRDPFSNKSFWSPDAHNWYESHEDLGWLGVVPCGDVFVTNGGKASVDGNIWVDVTTTPAASFPCVLLYAPWLQKVVGLKINDGNTVGGFASQRI